MERTKPILLVDDNPGDVGPTLRTTPSNVQPDIIGRYALGANGFVGKPVDFAERARVSSACTG